MFGHSDSKQVAALYRERAMHAGRAASAEDRGFPGTARAAREKVADIERRIAEAEAAEAAGIWAETGDIPVWGR